MPEDLAKKVLYEDAEQPRVDEALRLLVWQSKATYAPDGTHEASEVQADKTYVVCRKDKIILPENQYKWAAAAAAKIVELECGHSPFILEKETATLVEIISKAAGA